MKSTLHTWLFTAAALATCAGTLSLQSCGKSSPAPVITNTANVSKSDVGIPLYTGNSNGSGSKGGGGDTGGGSTGGGNTGGGSNGGNTGGGSTGGNTGGNGNTGNGGDTGGNTGGSTGGNTGNGGNNGGNTGGSSGAISSNGDTGIPIGPSGSITLKLGDKTYDLSLAKSDISIAAYIPAMPPLNVPSTTISIVSNSGGGLTIAFLVNETRPGVFDIAEVNITTVDGETYINTNPAQAKINFQTYTIKGQFVETKGTFDSILIEQTKGTNLRVSGSFNIVPL